MFKNILIPTDGSSLSRKASRAGIAFAKAVGAKVTAYRAIDLVMPYMGGEGALMDPAVIDMVEKTAQQEAKKSVAQIAAAAKTAGVRCQTYITRPITAYQGIIAAARRNKCDAIFIASHGRGGVASAILGSVTQRVLAHSKIPVLVYR